MAFPISGSFTESQIDKLNSITNDSENTQRRKNQELDKDAFLKLMTVQLQYQDPLSPMDNSQYITQMAQYSSVEQLANISEATETTNAYNEIIATQLKNLTDLITQMISDKSGDSEDTDENSEIVNQLVKINNAMEQYFGSKSEDEDEATSSDEILASLGN